MSSPIPIRIGTRGSPLALAQARETRERLAAAHPALAAPEAVEIVVIKTTGDMVQDRPLAAIGGKGLFTKEIEEALLDRRIDLAVHSMKDMPTILPEGLAILALLPREDPRDVLFRRDDAAGGLATLAPGAVVGTSSLRRQAQILARRPDLVIVPFRGNVDTRLGKLAEGRADATVLALAGLRRLGRGDRPMDILSVEEMLPAVAQGAIGLEGRAGDARIEALLAPLHDSATGSCVAAERALLAALDGSCRTPIAALAELSPGGRLSLRALTATPDGRRVAATAREGGRADAVRLGEDAGAELRARLPDVA
jgi:hydroxymethylbilane synthase